MTFHKVKKCGYHKHMLQINAELCFKSINEKHTLTFLFFTAGHKMTNVYIFFIIFSLFT